MSAPYGMIRKRPERISSLSHWGLGLVLVSACNAVDGSSTALVCPRRALPNGSEELEPGSLLCLDQVLAQIHYLALGLHQLAREPASDPAALCVRTCMMAAIAASASGPILLDVNFLLGFGQRL